MKLPKTPTTAKPEFNPPGQSSALPILPIREHFDRLLRDPHARTSTTALAIIGLLRAALANAAEQEHDASERQRLRNLAAALPEWGR